MTTLDFVLRIACAVLFGLAIGLERQLTGHVAGIRVNVLVCLGTCMFVLFSQVMEAPDATRIAAQIVSGVGFLCSGIIFKDGANVRGLNTAATIWCTAAIGVLASSGRVLLAALSTALLLTANVALRPLAGRVRPMGRFCEGENYYRVIVTCPEIQELQVRSAMMNLVAKTPLVLTGLESAETPGGLVEVTATLYCEGQPRDSAAAQLVGRVSLQQGVASAQWQPVLRCAPHGPAAAG